MSRAEDESCNCTFKAFCSRLTFRQKFAFLSRRPLCRRVLLSSLDQQLFRTRRYSPSAPLREGFVGLRRHCLVRIAAACEGHRPLKALALLGKTFGRAINLEQKPMKPFGLQTMAQLELPAFSLEDCSYPAVLERIQQCLIGLAPIAHDGTAPDSHMLALVKSLQSVNMCAC